MCFFFFLVVVEVVNLAGPDDSWTHLSNISSKATLENTETIFLAINFSSFSQCKEIKKKKKSFFDGKLKEQGIFFNKK